MRPSPDSNFYLQLKFTVVLRQLNGNKGPMPFLIATKSHFYERKAKARCQLPISSPLLILNSRNLTSLLAPGSGPLWKSHFGRGVGSCRFSCSNSFLFLLISSIIFFTSGGWKYGLGLNPTWTLMQFSGILPGSVQLGHTSDHPLSVRNLTKVSTIYEDCRCASRSMKYFGSLGSRTGGMYCLTVTPSANPTSVTRENEITFHSAFSRMDFILLAALIASKSGIHSIITCVPFRGVRLSMFVPNVPPGPIPGPLLNQSSLGASDFSSSSRVFRSFSNSASVTRFSRLSSCDFCRASAFARSSCPLSFTLSRASSCARSSALLAFTLRLATAPSLAMRRSVSTLEARPPTYSSPATPAVINTPPTTTWTDFHGKGLVRASFMISGMYSNTKPTTTSKVQNSNQCPRDVSDRSSASTDVAGIEDAIDRYERIRRICTLITAAALIALVLLPIIVALRRGL